MNAEDLERFRAQYAAMSDEEILELLNGGDEGFVDGAYSLMKEEASRRNLVLSGDKSGEKAELMAETAHEVEIQGRKLKCHFCEGEGFFFRSSLVNMQVLTQNGLDFVNQSADNYICAHCGYMMGFIPLPQ